VPAGEPTKITFWSQWNVCFTDSDNGDQLDAVHIQNQITIQTPHSWLWLHIRMRFWHLPYQTWATLSLGQLYLPHLNISECCWAATFHYQGDCLARGSPSFHPSPVSLGTCTSSSSSLGFFFLLCLLPLVLLVLWRKMRSKKKKKTVRGKRLESSQVKEKNLYRRKTYAVFKVADLHSLN